MADSYRQVWQRLAGEFPATPASRVKESGARRLLMVVNNPAFFLSPRLPLAQAALRAGFEVHVATLDGPSGSDILARGLVPHVIPLSRRGNNPNPELKNLQK